jgi:hypothetical protein
VTNNPVSFRDVKYGDVKDILSIVSGRVIRDDTCGDVRYGEVSY